MTKFAKMLRTRGYYDITSGVGRDLAVNADCILCD